MITVRSSLFDAHGFEHGFSTRRGGVSVGPFESLDLARTVGDDPEAVAENTRRFERAIGGPARLYEVSQVHGDTIVEVSDEPVLDVRTIEADGLLTRTAGAAVAVRTADCVPVLLADPKTGAVAAVHAGWRGVEARIVPLAVERLGHPTRLLAVIGPHIRLDAFEVGPEIAERIAAVAHGEPVVEDRDPRPHVDLARTLRAQLARAGVERIDDVGGCTHAEADRFFSHRRDRGNTGRHLSAIVAR